MNVLIVSRLLRSSRGAAMVEFALVAWLLLAVILAVLEGGLFMFQWTTLRHAVNHGARLAAIRETELNMVITAMHNDASPALTIQASDITITVDNGSSPFSGRKHGQRIQVSAAATYVPLFSRGIWSWNDGTLGGANGNNGGVVSDDVSQWRLSR